VHAFWLSLAMVFIAELGDKTQLVALGLAARFRAGVVLLGILAATLAVHVISVVLGGCAGKVLPCSWIQLFAGLSFIGFGLWTLRGDSLEDGDTGSHRSGSPFWIVTVTFFLAELGDKTMLTTVSLATDYSLLPVWLGSSLGMVVSDGLAILVGQLLGKNLPERAVKIGAACIFFAFGGFKVIQGAAALPPYAWMIGAGVSAVMLALFARARRNERQAPAGESCT